HLWDVVSKREITRLEARQVGNSSITFSPDGRSLACADQHGNALLWDMTLGARPEAGVNGLDPLWKDLCGKDSVRACRSGWIFVAMPEKAIAFIRTRLRPAHPVDERKIAGLFADLDSERFEVRERASRDLENMGSSIEPALRKRLDGSSSTEFRERAKSLLDKLASSNFPPETLDSLRALSVLERIGTAEARKVVKMM